MVAAVDADQPVQEVVFPAQRLVEGAKVLDFEIPYSVEEIDEACRQVMAVNKLANVAFGSCMESFILLSFSSTRRAP